eukprot:TRINITY_DN71202_c0_g1_i1.p1 TRINITY_DN71202_c0_g1~~TRINITY_DN71202_c0_g1_i1.p1  ORF type:complete len:240 (-),score=37.05 TRINITY_DN71202_c0_g1_i1:7-726(-)
MMFCGSHLRFPLLAMACCVWPRASGLGPGDQISGSEGEFFRYKHVFVKPPDDKDRMESLKISEDIKCAACEVLLQHLLKRAGKLTEDYIMDQFDGEIDEPIALTSDLQENRVNKNRKGCNKHFKDEVLLRGWSVRKCAETSAGPHAGQSQQPSAIWCLEQVDQLPSERDVDTYSIRNEAVFHACENTIGRNGAEIAQLVSELKEAGLEFSEIIRTSCRDAGRCNAPRKGKRRAGNVDDL